MKLPRTMHLPWSPGVSNDDKIIVSLKGLINSDLIITEKLDGECQAWGYDIFHVRSVDSNGGKLRSKAKSKWASISHLIPKDIILYIEDISNIHSIEYKDYSNTFFLIRAFDKKSNHFLEWDKCEKLAETISIPTVPIIKKTRVNKEESIHEINPLIESKLKGESEGFVIHTYDSFHKITWCYYVAKWVRENHVKTNERWETNALIKLNKPKE